VLKASGTLCLGTGNTPSSRLSRRELGRGMHGRLGRSLYFYMNFMDSLTLDLVRVNYDTRSVPAQTTEIMLPAMLLVAHSRELAADRSSDSHDNSLEPCRASF